MFSSSNLVLGLLDFFYECVQDRVEFPDIWRRGLRTVWSVCRNCWFRLLLEVIHLRKDRVSVSKLLVDTALEHPTKEEEEVLKTEIKEWLEPFQEAASQVDVLARVIVT